MKKSANILAELGNKKIRVQALQEVLFIEKGITVSAARLDELHPAISGNKYFKLKYNIKEALRLNCDTILTFGGAYSNHLAACSYACKEAGLKSIGIIRGERTEKLNHTLAFCRENGMELQFVSRQTYKQKAEVAFKDELKASYPSAFIIPEGGNNVLGLKGLKEILSSIPSFEKFTHIITAMGTGATFFGLLASSQPGQMIEGILVLKSDDLARDLEKQLSPEQKARGSIITDYHFGGYARKNQQLVDIMNLCYKKYLLPTDFVYTGKAFFAVLDRIDKNRYPRGAELLVLHTGGLQGNLSLPGGILLF